MKKLWNKIAPDKKKHVIAGILIMLFCLIFTDLETSVAIVCAVACAKEVYDFALYQLGKKPNWNPLWDILATVAIPLIIQIINVVF
jgi:hypothetical protein